MCLVYSYLSTELATFATYAEYACSWTLNRSRTLSRPFPAFISWNRISLPLGYYPLRLPDRALDTPGILSVGVQLHALRNYTFYIMLFTSGLRREPYNMASCSLLWLLNKLSLRVIAGDWGNLETLGSNTHIITYISMHYSYRHEEWEHTDVSLLKKCFKFWLGQEKGVQEM